MKSGSSRRAGGSAAKTIQGFTLLETLVALAITAIALAAVTKLAYQLTADTASVQDKVVATLIAENQLSRLQLEGTATRSPSSGEVTMLNVPWRYRVVREDTPDPNVQRVTVGVYLQDQDNVPVTRITTYLAMSSEATP